MPNTPVKSSPATTILMTFNITAYLAESLYSATTATKLAIPNLIPGMPGVYGIIASTYDKISASEARSATVATLLLRPRGVLREGSVEYLTRD